MKAAKKLSSASAASHHAMVKDLLLEAVLLPPSERHRFLHGRTGGDHELLAEIESLLVHFVEPEHRRRDSSDPVRRSAPRPCLEPGELVANRFEVEHLIGCGGMSEVYQVRDLLADERMALKVLTHAHRGHRARLLEEARLARRVSHPAVCRVHDVGEHDGALFLTMELIEGETLAERLAVEERLASVEVARIAAQICAALAAAHRAGVLHRDLKPDNVLLDERGDVHLTDFGIASRREASRPGESGRSLFGSPLYMAPEDLGAGAPTTERTDLYSLGALLYELAAGQPVFDGCDLDTLREMHLAATPEHLSRVVPDVDPELEALVASLLRKRPEDRPVSAAWCGAAFEEIVRRFERPRRPARRSPGQRVSGANASESGSSGTPAVPRASLVLPAKRVCGVVRPSRSPSYRGHRASRPPRSHVR